MSQVAPDIQQFADGRKTTVVPLEFFEEMLVALAFPFDDARLPFARQRLKSETGQRFFVAVTGEIYVEEQQ